MRRYPCAPSVQIRAAGVTAVITYNDLMAIGLLRQATEAGISVPNDLSIIGFDNSFGSDFTSPPLTTIGQPLLETGERATRTLLAILDGDADESIATLEAPRLRTSLIIRGSTAKPRG